MPGDPSAMLVGYPPSGGAQAPHASGPAAMVGGFGFTFWLILVGVVLPVMILGGLQFGGFSFVFRHR